MIRVILFVLGIFLCSISLAFMILYLNLFAIGYSFLEYVKFISRCFECYCFLLGILCIYISIKRWDKKRELLL